MSTIVCVSASGSPGVTTTALGMALTWSRDVLLADCDRDPSQAIQAGYLRGMDNGGRGLAALARLHRENRALAPDLWRHTVPLVQYGDLQRRFLPGFSQPATVRLFDTVWAELADAFTALDEQGVDVIVDAGRVGRDGLPLPLMAQADAVCFLTRTSLRALAATRLYLPLVAEQLERLPGSRALGLVLVDPNQPYAGGEIAAQFGTPCWAEVERNEKLAAVLSDGAPEPKRFTESSLMNQLRAAGLRLRERITNAAELERAITARTPGPARIPEHV
ncbi:hypothetical protein [Tessaracoccus antarcticus]|uniref:ParA family protein n=1 Tax=Tessaracoccus antarcticus TaxID=2479848 RepID=A0A3M0GFG2_9ACTN|nr:hypothetical protein [Tessaracoccus antarcticus]RMB61422.1 hypothetical protein EAX62_01835 [Tessaracoccus antarcticus]